MGDIKVKIRKNIDCAMCGLWPVKSDFNMFYAGNQVACLANHHMDTKVKLGKI